MLTPRQTVAIARCGFMLFALALVIAMLGPFQGAERYIGLSDKAAHMIAFYVLSLAAFTVAPTWRRKELGLGVVIFAIATEVLQGMTGRSMSLTDFAADMTGLIVALLPPYVERLRHLVRTQPDVDFRTIAALDRRQADRPRAARASGLAQV